MSKAYSIDLRERVVDYVEQGGRKAEASRIFKVGRDTVYRWLKQKKQTGHLAARPLGGKRHEKIREAALIEQIKVRPDATLEELGQIFGVTPPAIFYRLKRLKITRKKNNALQRKK